MFRRYIAAFTKEFDVVYTDHSAIHHPNAIAHFVAVFHRLNDVLDCRHIRYDSRKHVITQRHPAAGCACGVQPARNRGLTTRFLWSIGHPSYFDLRNRGASSQSWLCRVLAAGPIDYLHLTGRGMALNPQHHSLQICQGAVVEFEFISSCDERVSS